jgi:hypothetical protein
MCSHGTDLRSNAKLIFTAAETPSFQNRLETLGFMQLLRGNVHYNHNPLKFQIKFYFL